MKQRLFVLQMLLCFAITLSAFAQAPVRATWRDAQPKMVTLFARPHPPKFNLDSAPPPNPGYSKSAFSFQFGLRIDAGTGKTHNDSLATVLFPSHAERISNPIDIVKPRRNQGDLQDSSIIESCCSQSFMIVV